MDTHKPSEGGTTDVSSSLSMPLRRWIKGVLDSNGMGMGSRGGSSIPFDYLTSCLHVALALSKQISDAEQVSEEMLRLLPLDSADWAGSVTVKLKPNDRVDARGQDVRNVPSSCASAVFDGTSLQSIPFHRVDSAEIFDTNYFRIPSINNDRIDVHSVGEKRRRIHSLGLLFYELFSGGLVPMSIRAPSAGALDAPLHPGQNQDHEWIPAGFERLDLVRMAKPENGNDDDELYDSRGQNGTATRKKSHKPQASLNSSIETLKGLGLPYPLCDLIYNMLDCINGDLTGDDAYTEMSDVTADLQLMIDKPLLFFHDPDMVTLSSSGLQLKDNLFMRDGEFVSLQHAYERAISGSSEVAIISGGSGTGKSYLASRLGGHITSIGGIFLSVKFNQLKQANPFSAIVSAFNEYCNILMEMSDSEGVKLMASKLRDALGEDAHHLIMLIPKLSEILDCNSTDTSPSIQDCVNGQKKINYLLIRFVEVMSACSNVTLTLFLDDLQWADGFSLSVLQQIMMISNEDKRIFFVGCCRDDEMEDHHSFRNMVGKFIEYGIRMTMIRLDCMDRNSLHRMVSTLLCLSPRLVKGLSDIVYHKTKGNPLFVSRLLLSMNRDGLLNLSLTRRRWVWDKNLVKSIELPNDVASFFSRIISRLSPEVQTALQVLSCFGSAESCELEILEAKLGLEIVKPLEVAVDEGFVSKNDDKYRFAHDQIQEAAYIMVPLKDRCLEHLKYGLCLVEVSVEKASDCLLFTALGQVNLAGPSVVTDAMQSTEIAGHNLAAGKKAIEMSEFSCALRFFKSGILFLKENHWKENYSLSLELFGLAAKCSHVLGDFPCVTAMSEEVDKHVHCLDDKIDNSFVVMSSLANVSKISDAVTLGLSILSQLGYELPTSYSRSETMSLIKRAQKDLSAISDSDLLNYKRMTDKRHIMAMKCLSKLELPTLQVNPQLQPIVNLKMVNMTIEHGICDSSPVGFAYFASVLAKCGEMRDGYRFAKLAKALLDQVGSKETLGDVIFTTTEVLSFFEPLHTVNEYRIQGEAAALASGDVEYACLIRLSYCGTILRTGLDLLSVKDVFAQALRYMKRQNHLTGYYYLLPSNYSILVLLDEAVSETVTEDQLTNRQQVVIFYYQKMFLSLIMNMYDDMRRYGEKFFELRMSSWLLVVSNAGHEFFGGLVSFRIYRETGKTLWLERGKQCKASIQPWAEQGSLWNFEHKVFLLEAEEYYSCHDYSGAQVAYNNAIESASAHKFINDEALACELAGYFYLHIGNTTESLEHLIRAHGKYTQWGASLKVKKVGDFIKEEFGDVPLCQSAGTNSFQDVQDSRKRK
eukprot:CCRYP_002508-RA/>CCRYP_002508-RA protein AED:0.03 eAED:0.03 QI:1061/1/1/1/1/1/4/164/1320